MRTNIIQATIREIQGDIAKRQRMLEDLQAMLPAAATQNVTPIARAPVKSRRWSAARRKKAAEAAKLKQAAAAHPKGVHKMPAKTAAATAA